MPSVGAAAVQGIEAGFSLGQRGLQMRQSEQDRLKRERDAEKQSADLQEERAYQRTRQKAQDARLATQDDRQRRMDELAMLDKEAADLQTEGQGLFAQFGGYDKVPEDVRGDYTNRVRDARGRRTKLRQSFYSQDVGEQKKQAAEVWSRVQAGQMSLDDVGDDDLVRTLTVQTRRPLTDFVRQDPGTPSAVEQAALDVEAGLETGNRDLLVKGANVLLRPELTTGIGTDGPDGNEIVDKRLVDLVPHPQQPGLFVPILEVTVRRDDGAVGRYRAPVTEGRGVYATDPGAMPKAISVQDAMDRVGQMSALAQFVNQPDVRARLDRATPQARASADEFLQALGSVGVAAPKAKKITRERVDLGDHIVEREVDESGRIVSEKKLTKGAAPKAGRGGGGGGGGGLAAPTSDLTGEAFLATLPPQDRALVKGLADGSVVPNDIELKGGRRERMLAAAKQFTGGEANLTGRKPENEKPLPAKERQLLVEARSNAATMSSLLGEFKDDFASKGILGLGSDLSLQAKSVFGSDKPSVQWWKNYRKMAELVERHAMFGASLTAGEQSSWRSADIGPGMDADVIRANLTTRSTLAQKVLEATQQDLIDSGYADKRVRGIGGRDVAVPLDGQPRGQGVTGSWDEGGKPQQPAAAPPRTATNPKTGEKLILKDGQWQPLR